MSSEPMPQMTERGKRLLASLLTPVEPSGARFLLTQDILAIENEAREQGAREERERLRGMVERMALSSSLREFAAALLDEPT